MKNNQYEKWRAWKAKRDKQFAEMLLADAEAKNPPMGDESVKTRQAKQATRGGGKRDSAGAAEREDT